MTGWSYIGEEKDVSVPRHCFNCVILSDICPIYSTCLSHSEAVRALSPRLKGRIKLFCNVSDLLGLSVNATIVSQEMYDSSGSSVFVKTHGIVEVGLGGWFSGEQSSVGEGRPSESSLSRGT